MHQLNSAIGTEMEVRYRKQRHGSELAADSRHEPRRGQSRRRAFTSTLRFGLIMARPSTLAAGFLTWALTLHSATAGSIAYLGPAGSWTHQACLDLYGEQDLVAMSRDELFSAYKGGKVERACVPVTTSVVGVTPYMDAVLDLPDVTVVAEYPKMLGYSLLARPGTKREDIKEVLAHPVAFEEVKP